MPKSPAKAISQPDCFAKVCINQKIASKTNSANSCLYKEAVASTLKPMYLRRLGWSVIATAGSSVVFAILGLGILDPLGFADTNGWLIGWVTRLGGLAFGFFLLRQASD